MRSTQFLLADIDEAKFWDRVSKCAEAECWEWVGSCRESGYGRLKVKGSWRAAHRVSYVLAHGDIPEGKVLDHLCRNRKCVNPAHLEAVDDKTNVLRGIGPSAVMAQRTHCDHGHPLDGDNLIIKKHRRVCRTCKKRWERNGRAKDRAIRLLKTGYHPLGHVRDSVLELPKYGLRILLNGFPAHGARCRRAWAQRERIRQVNYDPSDRMRNECLDVPCDCGADGRYARYLEDKLIVQAQALAVLGAEMAAFESKHQAVLSSMDGWHAPLDDGGDRMGIVPALNCITSAGAKS